MFSGAVFVGPETILNEGSMFWEVSRCGDLTPVRY